MTPQAEQYLDKARSLLVAAEGKIKKADADKWAAVECISKAKDEGASVRDIASHVGIAIGTVSQYCKMWREFGSFTAVNRPTFTEAQNELFPSKESAAREERAAKAVLSDPTRAAKALDSLDTESKAGVVKHVAKSDKAAMTDAMLDPKARMRAEGASSRARDITLTEAKNERKASGKQAPVDGGAAALFAIGTIMSDGAAWAGRLSDAYEQALRVCSDDQIEAIRGRVNTGSFAITKVIGDITGSGIDAALAEILQDTEA